MSAEVLGQRGALELHHSQVLQKCILVPVAFSSPGNSGRLRSTSVSFLPSQFHLSLSSALTLPFFPFPSGKEQEPPPTYLVVVPELLKKPLTLVVGGDSPSAVMDFSSIFSSLVSSTAGFSITSCFFSGLAVLAGQQEKNPEMDVYWNDSGQCRQLCGLLGAARSVLGLHTLSLLQGTSHLQLHCKYHRARAPLALSGTSPASSRFLVAPPFKS